MRALAYYQTNDSPSDIAKFEQAFLNYCDLNFHQPLATFGDARDIEALTEYQRMLEHIKMEKGGFLVVIPDASHLGCDVEIVARKLVELDNLSTKVICDNDDNPDPLQDALTSLGVRGVSLKKSQRIRKSMHKQALQGQNLGRSPFGYRTDQNRQLIIVEQEANIIRSIFKTYIEEGLGLRRLAEFLNRQGFVTRSSGQWSVIGIRDILRNPVYMGTYTRYGLRLPKNHEAIISPQVFREAQDITKSRKPISRQASREPFILSGLAYCSYCGNSMMGVTRRQSWKRKDGSRSRGVYRYYQCQSKINMSTCRYHTWRANDLETTVLKDLRDTLAKKGSIKFTGDNSDTENDNAVEIKNAERRFLKIIRMVARGQLDIKDIQESLYDLDTIRAEISKDTMSKTPEDMLADWEELDVSEQQSCLSNAIHSVHVKDDRVKLVI